MYASDAVTGHAAPLFLSVVPMEPSALMMRTALSSVLKPDVVDFSHSTTIPSMVAPAGMVKPKLVAFSQFDV